MPRKREVNWSFDFKKVKILNYLRVNGDGARYIHSASEPYTEEQEISQDRVDSWLEHFGMHKFQSHCSGHARGQDLLKAVSEIEAKTLYPIHTEHPEAYKAVSNNMILVQEGKKYEL